MATSRALRPSLAAGLLQQCSRPAAVSSLPIPPFYQPQQPHPGSSLQTRPAPPPSSRSPFSTSTLSSRRHVYPGARNTRDNNPHRGESTIRRTGTRWRLSVSDEPLPVPVPQEDLPAVKTDPDHGLWDFFYDRELVVRPTAEAARHGRPWMVEELRAKSWDDLHALWWVCCKERNRIATMTHERETGKYGDGMGEDRARDRVVLSTMRAIKHVLTERYYLWEDAVKLAKQDLEIDLSGKGQVYTPQEFLMEEDPDQPEEISAEDMERLKAGEEVPESLRPAQGGAAAAAAARVDPSTIPAAAAETTPKEAPRV